VDLCVGPVCGEQELRIIDNVVECASNERRRIEQIGTQQNTDLYASGPTATVRAKRHRRECLQNKALLPEVLGLSSLRGTQSYDGSQLESEVSWAPSSVHAMSVQSGTAPEAQPADEGAEPVTGRKNTISIQIRKLLKSQRRPEGPRAEPLLAHQRGLMCRRVRLNDACSIHDTVWLERALSTPDHSNEKLGTKTKVSGHTSPSVGADTIIFGAWS
jgi:hypothetical protein